MNVTETPLSTRAAAGEVAAAARPNAVGTDFEAQLARAMGADGPATSTEATAEPSAGDAATASPTPEPSLATTSGSGSAPAGTEPLTLGQMLHLYTLPPGTVNRTPELPAAAASRGPAAAAGEVRSTAGATVRSAAAVGPSANGDDLGVGSVARPLPGAVGSAYGNRVHPIHGGVKMHHGADIGAPTGTPIHAFAAGTVTFAGERGGYGNMVIVEHANGITSRYAHQSAMDVTVGQRVAAGEQLGQVGATGTATGPHLHFELRRDGESFDPGPWLP